MPEHLIHKTVEWCINCIDLVPGMLEVKGLPGLATGFHYIRTDLICWVYRR